PPGGGDAGDDAEHDREHRAERDHEHRVLDRVPELAEYRSLGAQRAAQIAMRETIEIDRVLLPLRLVQPELLALILLELLRALPAPQRRHGVAGNGAEEYEVQRDRDEDGRDGEEEPLDDIVGAPHVVSGAVATVALSCVRPFAGSCSSAWSTR